MAKYQCEDCNWRGNEPLSYHLEDRCPNCKSLDLSTTAVPLEAEAEKQGEGLITMKAEDVQYVIDHLSEQINRLMELKLKLVAALEKDTEEITIKIKPN